jgi:hypothetical protein
MKSLILSLVMTVILIIIATILFNRLHTRRRALLLLYIFIATLPVYVIVFLTTPPDLWFLPGTLTDSNYGFALGFGLFIHMAFFGGGTLQLYNLADRGFSLRILIDILESPTRELTLIEILENYGGGKGIDWMYKKRIEGMLENQLIQINQEDIQITDKGMKVAKYFSRMRKFLNLEVDFPSEAL